MRDERPDNSIAIPKAHQATPKPERGSMPLNQLDRLVESRDTQLVMGC